MIEVLQATFSRHVDPGIPRTETGRRWVETPQQMSRPLNERGEFGGFGDDNHVA
jgi:hypothetical protein